MTQGKSTTGSAYTFATLTFITSLSLRARPHVSTTRGVVSTTIRTWNLAVPFSGGPRRSAFFCDSGLGMIFWGCRFLSCHLLMLRCAYRASVCPLPKHQRQQHAAASQNFLGDRWCLPLPHFQRMAHVWYPPPPAPALVQTPRPRASALCPLSQNLARVGGGCGSGGVCSPHAQSTLVSQQHSVLVPSDFGNLPLFRNRGRGGRPTPLCAKGLSWRCTATPFLDRMAGLVLSRERPRTKGLSVMSAPPAPPELSRNVLRPACSSVGPCSI